VTVTGSRILQRNFSAPAKRATMLSAETYGNAMADQGSRLRAAAAAGRTAELEAILAQGVPVDAPDSEGSTALMKSILADQPAAAGILRRHGASLDRKDHAGVSARDMAGAKDDPELDRALGLDAEGRSRIGSQ
jgi:hypothetical protein